MPISDFSEDCALVRKVFSSLWWVGALCALERTMPLAKASFSESSSLEPLAGSIAHPSVLGLGNLGCYSLVSTFDPGVFSSASTQAPLYHCFSGRQRGCFCMGNAILLCSPPPLQRRPGHPWCMERDGWLPSRGCEREDTVWLPNRAAYPMVQTILWIFKR